MGVRVNPSRIRFEMARRGLSGNELARLAHVSPATVSMAVNGREVAAGTLAKLAIGLSRADPVPGLGELLDVPAGLVAAGDQVVL